MTTMMHSECRHNRVEWGAEARFAPQGAIAVAGAQLRLVERGRSSMRLATA